MTANNPKIVNQHIVLIRPGRIDCCLKIGLCSPQNRLLE